MFLVHLFDKYFGLITLDTIKSYFSIFVSLIFVFKSISPTALHTYADVTVNLTNSHGVNVDKEPLAPAPTVLGNEIIWFYDRDILL